VSLAINDKTSHGSSPGCRRTSQFWRRMLWLRCHGPLIIRMAVMLLEKFMEGQLAQRRGKDQNWLWELMEKVLTYMM
jgi:hypothetical protein